MPVLGENMLKTGVIWGRLNVQKGKKEIDSGGLCRELDVLFLDRLSSCMHCKFIGPFGQVCNVVFCFRYQCNSRFASDAFCTTFLCNSYNCSNG